MIIFIMMMIIIMMIMMIIMIIMIIIIPSFGIPFHFRFVFPEMIGWHWQRFSQV